MNNLGVLGKQNRFSVLNLNVPSHSKLIPVAAPLPLSRPHFNSLSCKIEFLMSSKLFIEPNSAFLAHTERQRRLICKMNRNSDIVSELELGKHKEKQKPEKRVNGIFWILLINLVVYVADRVFQVRWIKDLYLYHSQPALHQFITSTFCHFNWSHLSSNLFFLYIFGKLVEEEEGISVLWLSYILTGAGANLISWRTLPRNVVSVGASGSVFGLFAISVLVKMSWGWGKILEVLILGQFVVEKVLEAAKASTSLASGYRGVYGVQNVTHIAHLSGALVGVVIWLLSRVLSPPVDGK